jgi:hypothetical protein
MKNRQNLRGTWCDHPFVTTTKTPSHQVIGREAISVSPQRHREHTERFIDGVTQSTEAWQRAVGTTLRLEEREFETICLVFVLFESQTSGRQAGNGRPIGVHGDLNLDVGCNVSVRSVFSVPLWFIRDRSTERAMHFVCDDLAPSCLVGCDGGDRSLEGGQ